MFDRFVRFAVERAKLHTSLSPVPALVSGVSNSVWFFFFFLSISYQDLCACFFFKDKFRNLKSKDEKTVIGTVSYQAPKIRLLRGLSIDAVGSGGIHVLDLAVFSKPEFDLPIFCANCFTTPRISIVVLWVLQKLVWYSFILSFLLLDDLSVYRDLNPLYNTVEQRDYKDKYYNHLLPLSQKYSKVWSLLLLFFSHQ